ncbi:MAG: hypothetical protein CVV64_10190 [Candidatus Wallbacteria bacterium HGW-Wallbacteria-1]|uniref:Uncharacterized protein n=1 Tax=Candidatus Wallbacteria bacterium HGW-Wallbacteria-1 TaxID=2013854 RepID=A0A2N1PPQ9_9BACT|nr:MAG: hypothetical protein CVV64_10190 [Candidatus Wallbacteria bacterium HGW-Wallbacteria-1]
MNTSNVILKISGFTCTLIAIVAIVAFSAIFPLQASIASAIDGVKSTLHCPAPQTEFSRFLDFFNESFSVENPIRVARKFQQYFIGKGETGAALIFERVHERLSGQTFVSSKGSFLTGKGSAGYDQFNDVYNLVMRTARQIQPRTDELLSRFELEKLFRKLNFTQYVSTIIPRLYHLEKMDIDNLSVSEGAGTSLTADSLQKQDFSVATGYPERVKSVVAGKRHTFSDFDQYLFDRFPKALVKELTESGRVIEFHFFPANLSFNFLRSRGYSEFYKIGTISGLSHKGLYIAARDGGRDPIYVANHIFGVERLWHVMLNLRLCRINGKGVRGSQIRVATTPAYSPEMTRKYYDSALSDIMELPETLIINYQNSILKALVQRKRAREFFSYLKGRYGSNPFAGFIRDLRKEAEDSVPLSCSANGCDEFHARRESLRIVAKVLENHFAELVAAKLTPTSLDAAVLSENDVFRSEVISSSLCRTWDYISATSAFLKNSPLLDELAAFPEKNGVNLWFEKDFRFGRTVWDGVLNRTLFTYLDSEGISHDAVIFRCVWGGDSIDALGRVLASRMKGNGKYRIVHLGTAGSATESFGVGSVHVPDRILDWNFERVDRRLANDILPLVMKRGPLSGVLAGAGLVRVWSPLVESMDFLARMKQDKLTTVEVEVAALHRVFEEESEKGLNVKFSSMMIITDLLGSDITLEQHGTTNVDLEMAGFRKAFEYLVNYLDISDVMP